MWASTSLSWLTSELLRRLGDTKWSFGATLFNRKSSLTNFQNGILASWIQHLQFFSEFTLSYPIIESGIYWKVLNMSLCCILNTKHYSPINAIITQKWGGNQSSCLPVIITPFYQIAYQHPYYCKFTCSTSTTLTSFRINRRFRFMRRF